MVIYILQSTLFTIAQGFHHSASILIEQSIAERNELKAKSCVNMHLKIAIPFFVIMGMVIVSSRYQLAFLLVQNPIIKEYVTFGLYILGITIFFGGVETVLIGIIFGMNYKTTGLLTKLLICYLIGIPISYYLSLSTSMGFLVLLLSIPIAHMVLTLIFFGIILSADWSQIIHDA